MGKVKALTIGWINLQRMLRERSNIFFVFIFPLALVLLIGVQFGGGFEPRLGVHDLDDGVVSDAIIQEMETAGGVEIVAFETIEEVVEAVEQGTIQAGVSIPVISTEDLASDSILEIGFVSRPDGFGAELQAFVGSAVSTVLSPVGAARFASDEMDVSFDVSLVSAQSLVGASEPVTVATTTVGEAVFPSTLGQFDLGASSQLVLFVFLTAMAGSSALILTRQLGISKRMLSTPTSIGTIVTGEALGRFGTAILQGLYIIVLTLVMFSVNWGDPIGALLILIALSAVGAGAGMLLGATFKNDQQAGGVAVVLSLGLAALGGAMFPLDLFSPAMQRLAHITPHAWALDGFAELVRRDGTVADILPELGVLAVYAVVLLSLAAWRLRVAITRP